MPCAQASKQKIKSAEASIPGILPLKTDGCMSVSERNQMFAMHTESVVLRRGSEKRATWEGHSLADFGANRQEFGELRYTRHLIEWPISHLSSDEERRAVFLTFVLKRVERLTNGIDEEKDNLRIHTVCMD